MKILITGGAGFKGLKLAQALLERDHQVTILDNFMYGYESCLFLFQYQGLTVLDRDIRNLVPADVAGFDYVFHLAGISSYPACEANPHSAQMINLEGTEILLSVLAPEQRLVNASTTSIYGKNREVCTEESLVEPSSLYARTKYEAEKRCMEREGSTSLRFATIFGISPRMRRDLLPNDFVMRAVQERNLVLFDSASVRTFLHVDDAIDSYLLTLERWEDMSGEVFNVGSEKLNLSKMQIAQKIKEYVDFEIIDSSLADLDKRDFVINFDKISALGFEPKTTLDEGVRELVKLFRFYRPTTPYRAI